MRLQVSPILALAVLAVAILAIIGYGWSVFTAEPPLRVRSAIKASQVNPGQPGKSDSGERRTDIP